MRATAFIIILLGENNIYGLPLRKGATRNAPHRASRAFHHASAATGARGSKIDAIGVRLPQAVSGKREAADDENRHCAACLQPRLEARSYRAQPARHRLL